MIRQALSRSFKFKCLSYFQLSLNSLNKSSITLRQGFYFSTSPQDIKNQLQALLRETKTITPEFNKQVENFKKEALTDIAKTLEVNEAICAALSSVLGNKADAYKAAVKQYAKYCVMSRDVDKVLSSQEKIAETFEEDDASKQCIENLVVLYHYYTNKKMHQKALDSIELMIKKMTKAEGQWTTRMLGTYIYKAYCLAHLGRKQQNLKLLNYLHDNYDKYKSPQKDSGFATVYSLLAQSYIEKSKFQLADQFIQKAKSLCHKESPGWENIMLNISLQYQRREKHKQALNILDEIFQFQSAKEKKNQRLELAVLIRKLFILDKTQDYQEKYKISKAVLQRQSLLELQDLEITFQSHVNTCEVLGYYEQARQCLNRLIQIYDTKLKNPQYIFDFKISPMFKVASMHFLEQNHKLAAEIYEQTYQLFQAHRDVIMRKQNNMELHLCMNLFQSYFYLKNGEKCEEYGAKSWQQLQQKLDPNTIPQLGAVVINPILDFYYHYTVVARMLKMDKVNYLTRYNKFSSIVERVKDKKQGHYFNYMIESSVFKMFQGKFKEAQEQLKEAEQWCHQLYKGTQVYQHNLLQIQKVRQSIKQHDRS